MEFNRLTIDLYELKPIHCVFIDFICSDAFRLALFETLSYKGWNVIRDILWARQGPASKTIKTTIN
jgi:hypothetical protein